MKLFLLMFAILLRIACDAQSLPTDTLCLPVDQVKTILTDARQKPILLQRISMLQQDIENYTMAIASLQSAINNTERKDSAVAVIQKRENDILLSQIADYRARLATVEKKLKRAIRGGRWAGGSGLVLTLLAGFFYITK